MTTPKSTAFDEDAAETEADLVYGRGGWLSDKGIAFVSGARWQFDQDQKEIAELEAKIKLLNKDIQELEALYEANHG